MFPDLHSLQVSGYYRPFRIFKVQQRKLKLLPAISPSLSLGLLLSHPLALKAAPTGCGFAFGDLLTQYFNRDQSVSFSEQYKVERGLSMMLIGVMAVGPTLLHFNRWMDWHILPHAASAPTTVTLKFLLDQIVGCMFWQAAYLSISEPYRNNLLGACEKMSMQGQIGLRAVSLAPSS